MYPRRSLSGSKGRIADDRLGGISDSTGRSKQADTSMMKFKGLVLGINIFTDWRGNNLKVVLVNFLD